jgi:transaldolase
MTNRLDQLREMTVVVADTGDLAAVAELKPQDCTTNPSLVLKAIDQPGFAEHFDRAIRENKGDSEAVADDLTVSLGVELTKLVPGRVSTEVDARYSFDIDASLAKARSLIEAYDDRGVRRDRILIKLAATWEGIRAAEILQAEGVDCNLTLIFSIAQAQACADAGVFLISPFVGRITDWHSKSTGKTYGPEEDPGVLSVRKIYDYYKSNDIRTIVMGASFRNVGQVAALAGCDQLTISPNLLSELAADETPLTRVLSPEMATGVAPVTMKEPDFRWAMNEDQMATEKLSEGIRNFHADSLKLLRLIETAQAA